MAYQQNIPQPTDQLSNSQADLLGNFQALNTYLTVNHTAIDGTAAQGKHKWVSLPEQLLSPGTLVNEGAVFSAEGLTSTKTELWWQNENNGATIPLTELFIPGLGIFSFYLPSGLIVKIREVTIAAQAAPGPDFVTPAPFVWPVVPNQPVFSNPPFVWVQVLRTTVGGNRDIVAIVNNNNTTATQVEITFQLTTTTWPAFGAYIFAIGG